MLSGAQRTLLNPLVYICHNNTGSTLLGRRHERWLAGIFMLRIANVTLSRLDRFVELLPGQRRRRRTNRTRSARPIRLEAFALSAHPSLIASPMLLSFVALPLNPFLFLSFAALPPTLRLLLFQERLAVCSFRCMALGSAASTFFGCGFFDGSRVAPQRGVGHFRALVGLPSGCRFGGRSGAAHVWRVRPGRLDSSLRVGHTRIFVWRRGGTPVVGGRVDSGDFVGRHLEGCGRECLSRQRWERCYDATGCDLRGEERYPERYSICRPDDSG
jgi:hypothetical protein